MAYSTRRYASLTPCLLLLAGCTSLMPTREPPTLTHAFSPFGAGRTAYQELADAFPEEYPFGFAMRLQVV